MQRRPARISLLAFLLAGAVAASYLLWTLDRRGSASVAIHAEMSARLARMSETVAGIGAAQQSYLVPGQLDEPWFERTSTLLERLSADLDQARVVARSLEAADTLRALADSTGQLVTADARARRNLQLGQELMAADVIASDGRSLLDAMTSRISGLQDAERAYAESELQAVARARWITLGTVAALWLSGLLALVAVPRPVSVATPADPPPPVSMDPPVENAPEPPARQPSHVDLDAVAQLCTDLSRVSASDALPDLLGRAAGLLDASGLALWMVRGERLLPVMAHGYPAHLISSMSPVARDDDNAAAAAWRTSQPAIVGATPSSPGAIVVPLLGLDSCVGVLALEVRGEREQDPAAQAVAALVAAQLVTILPALPSESTQASEDAPGESAPESQACSA